MATGKSISEFTIDDVSEGCNYADDITALKKNQSPDSINVEFFNGHIRKRFGEYALNTPPTGQGGIDAYTKLLLHMDGTNGSTTFTDSEITPKTVTAQVNAQISTTQTKFGSGSGLFNGAGNDSYTKLLLHMDDVGLTDSESTPKTPTLGGSVARSATQSKFGGFSAVFNGTTDYIKFATHADFNFGSGDFTIDAWVYLSSTTGPQTIVGHGSAANEYALLYYDGTNFAYGCYQAGLPIATVTGSTAPTISTWYHVAIVRNGSAWTLYVNGVAEASTSSASAYPTYLSSLGVGATLYDLDANKFYYMNGYLDEVRISKGIARWTSTFTPPTVAYSLGDYLSVPDSADWSLSTGDFTVDVWVRFGDTNGEQVFLSQYDSASTYWKIYKDASQKLAMTFYSAAADVGTYIMTSSWGVAANTWYHLAFVRSGSSAYIFINGVGQPLTTTTAFGTLPNCASVLYIGQSGATTNFLTAYVDELRFSKGIARYTADFIPAALAYDTYNASDSVVGFSLIDFSDTSDYHKQIAHIGNTVYSFDRLTSTRATLRSGAPRYRSFNAKVSSYLIQTYSDYSAPYYWDGSSSSMAVVSSNITGFKRAIEFQGYMIGMNTSANPTRCYYQPVGNILGAGAAWDQYFTLTPAPNDDEITDPFLLNGRLYAGTNYGIFRISFVGGVTVFEFKQVISDIGIVPGTAQTVITKQFGQVVIFLGTDKRLYMFDGANVKTISDLFYYKNTTTPIALELIDDNYKQNSFAVFDTVKRVYRLFITKRASSTNYYAMNVDVDTFAYYPYDNMVFSAGCMGYDALLRPSLICLDYSGIIHKMFIDYPTDNGTSINEYYTSPLVSSRGSAIAAGEGINFWMKPSSSANLLVYDKTDFRREWQYRNKLPLASSRDKFLGESLVLGSGVLGSEKDILDPQITIKSAFNSYQFKVYCDRPTAAAWEILNISVDESKLKFGKAEPQR